jgi:hypothetical protein
VTTQIRTARPTAIWHPRLWKYFGVYGLLATVVLYPIALVKVPGLEDYPNHLARMYILTHYRTSDTLEHFYEVKWRPIPYLGMEAIFVPLSHFASVYTAGRIFVGLCVLLPVMSVAALHYSVHRRLSLVPAAAFLLSYNAPLIWGFLNYLSTLSLAVIVFAGWIATTNWSRWPRLLVFSVLTLALYLGHLVAFGGYCLMVLCFEVVRASRMGFLAWRLFIVDWIFAALQAIPALTLAFSIMVNIPSSPFATNYGTIPEKIKAILSPTLFSLTTEFSLSKLSKIEIICGPIAVSIFLFGYLTNRVKLSLEIFPIFVVVGLMSLCIPHSLFGVFGMDFRLPLLAAILLLSAISTTERASSLFRGAILSIVMLLVAVRSAIVFVELRKIDSQITEIRQLVGLMPKGMRMLTVYTNNGAKYSVHVTHHAPLLAVIDRDAFVPTLFTWLTVKPRPEFIQMSSPIGLYPDATQLNRGYGSDDPSQDISSGEGGRIYWLGWERKFDYVLVMHFGIRPTALPKILKLIAYSNVADLYAIDGPLETPSR